MTRTKDASDDTAGIKAIKKTHQEQGLVAVIAGKLAHVQTSQEKSTSL